MAFNAFNVAGHTVTYRVDNNEVIVCHKGILIIDLSITRNHYYVNLLIKPDDVPARFAMRCLKRLIKKLGRKHGSKPIKLYACGAVSHKFSGNEEEDLKSLIKYYNSHGFQMAKGSKHRMMAMYSTFVS